MLKSKYLRPHRPCQEGQLDHENPQDPREWETIIVLGYINTFFFKKGTNHKGDECTYSLTRFTRLTSRSLETLRALRENNTPHFKPLFNSIVLRKSFLHKGFIFFYFSTGFLYLQGLQLLQEGLWVPSDPGNRTDRVSTDSGHGPG